MREQNYDSTVARIAGNIIGGYLVKRGLSGEKTREVVAEAVTIARAIVAEVERTEPLGPEAR